MRGPQRYCGGRLKWLGPRGRLESHREADGRVRACRESPEASAQQPAGGSLSNPLFGVDPGTAPPLSEAMASISALQGQLDAVAGELADLGEVHAATQSALAASEAEVARRDEIIASLQANLATMALDLQVPALPSPHSSVLATSS